MPSHQQISNNHTKKSVKETDISTDVLETDNNISVVGNVKESDESICVDDAGQSEQTPAICRY